MQELKLHLGCGERYLPGYTHIDLDNYPHINYRHDVHDLSMFEDETVDEIYCSHTFEYFDRKEAEDVLHEWYRVLRPGGILRVAVPDF
jgi:predicted SAM-dependent methyltransferase